MKPLLLLATLVACSPKVADPGGGGGTGGEADTGPPEGDELYDATVPEILSSETCRSCGNDCLVEELSYEGSPHVSEPIDYADTPPVGGPHNPCWASWGVHIEPVPDDNWVHNLEHGGVVFLYDCPDGCEEERLAIEALAVELDRLVLVSPYSGLDRGFAVLSWGHRMQSSCFDEQGYRAFYEAHVDQAPESTTSQPSADCM